MNTGLRVTKVVVVTKIRINRLHDATRELHRQSPTNFTENTLDGNHVTVDN